MSRAVRAILVLCLGASVLGACGGYRLVEPERRPVGSLYTVEPQIAWSARTRDEVEIWTVDGEGLAAVYFVDGIKDGDAIFPKRFLKAREVQPEFRAEMTEIEVMEFVTDTMAETGLQRIETRALRPARFGALDGYRYELSCLSPNGLEMEGLVIGAVEPHEDGARLHLIIYLGARAHYFPIYREVVERLIESLEM